MKAQWIRLADVFVIGPLMTYGGYRLARTEKVLGWLLAGLGVSTVVYNGVNYLKVRESQGFGATRTTRAVLPGKQRGSRCRYIKVCDPSPLVPVDQVSFLGLGPYLGSGTNKVLQGTIRDHWGISINGTLVVRLGSTLVGHTTSAAGHFSVYDLPPGTYKCTVTLGGGQSMTKNLTLPFSGMAVYQF